MRSIKEEIGAAGIARSDLNIFYAIIALCENGLLHSASYKGAERIIKICKRESGKRLREHDRAVARLQKVIK